MTLLNTLLDRRTLTCALLDRLADAAPTEDGKPGQLVNLALDHDLDPPYLTAWLDMLAALGAVRVEPGTLTARVSSVQASYFLRMLAALLYNGAPLVADWQREGLIQRGAASHPFHNAVDLLAALELRRLELIPDAAPLRETYAAFGLIARRESSGKLSYLLVLDSNADAWQLPGGRAQLEDGTLRRTLLRELSEELECGRLAEPADLTLTALGPLLSNERLSPTYGLLTRTSYQIYAARFTCGLPRLHDGLRWMSEAEVLNGQTSDGEHLSAEPLQLLYERGELDLAALLSD